MKTEKIVNQQGGKNIGDLVYLGVSAAASAIGKGASSALGKVNKSLLVPALATIYAAISVQNIAHFFQDLGHDGAISWTGGIAIGATLVILAHYLSETSPRDKAAFWSLLGVTLVFVALTTIVQGNNYYDELEGWGYVFAFVLAGAGELALPLAYAVAENAKRRREVTEASQMAEQIAATSIVEVMKGLDVARAQRQAEKRIERLIVAHVDNTVTKLMPRGHDAPTPTPTIEVVAPPMLPQVENTSGESGKHFAENAPNLPAFGPQNLPSANSKRKAMQADRQGKVLAALRDAYNGKPADDLNKTALAKQIGTTRPTLLKDLAALEESGQLSMNGVIKCGG